MYAPPLLLGDDGPFVSILARYISAVTPSESQWLCTYIPHLQYILNIMHLVHTLKPSTLLHKLHTLLGCARSLGTDLIFQCVLCLLHSSHPSFHVSHTNIHDSSTTDLCERTSSESFMSPGSVLSSWCTYSFIINPNVVCLTPSMFTSKCAF